MTDLLKQLKAEKSDIDSKIRAEEDRIIAEKENAVLKRLDALTEEEKEFILSHLDHSCTSCSDENPCNGYSSYNGTYRCSKCMLIEIFNRAHGGTFDFDFDVTITRVGV